MYELKLGLKRAELNEHVLDCVRFSSGKLVYYSISGQGEWH